MLTRIRLPRKVLERGDFRRERKNGLRIREMAVQDVTNRVYMWIGVTNPHFIHETEAHFARSSDRMNYPVLVLCTYISLLYENKYTSLLCICGALINSQAKSCMWRRLWSRTGMHMPDTHAFYRAVHSRFIIYHFPPKMLLFKFLNPSPQRGRTRTIITFNAT